MTQIIYNYWDRKTNKYRFMKNYFYLVLVIVVGSCCLNYKKPIARAGNFDRQIDAKILLDSLQLKEKVDTMLILKLGCVGCISGSANLNYIYWKKNGIFKLRKISNFGNQLDIRTHYNFLDYYFDHENEIKNSKLNEPTYFAYHYKYTEIVLIAGLNKFSAKIIDNYFVVNSNNPLINWIYRIEGDLLKIENAY